MTQDSDAKREDSGVERVDRRSLRGLRSGGMTLLGLKLVRVRRGLTQRELAERVNVPLHYVQRVEQGSRGCNKSVAQKMADVLEVDLQELRAEPDEEEVTATIEAARPEPEEEPSPPRPGAPRYLHKAYLKLLLEREVGSAYVVLDENELESYSEELSVEEVVKVIFRRRRELPFLEELLASGAELHPQVRLFLEELVRERPGEDIRVLAARRTREASEEGRQRLTQAMRELL